MFYGLDFGHCLSGADTGAEGNGYKEQYLTREVGKLVQQKLINHGMKVIICSCDTANTLNDSLNFRCSIANDYQVNILISIHFNADGGVGTEIYVYDISKENIEAHRILNNFNSIGFPPHNGGIKDGHKLAVIKNSHMKAMLVECCYIDSTDMKKYNAENFANAIVNGLLNISNIQTGWKEGTNGRWCFILSDGTLLKNSWLKDSKGWCYLDSEGWTIINGFARDSIGIAIIENLYWTGKYK